MSGAYYNEIDPFTANWLRALIRAGHIAAGDVDERSIEDVTPNDIKHYTQCHFFAGIGGWSYALGLAGWPDDRPVWTGSCPCQPFSAAGKRAGIADERHLWPAFYHLISECGPATVFGEQVASPDGLNWLDLVQADMEGAGYAFAANDICAAGLGAPHIRQRLWFVADASGEGLERRIGMPERAAECAARAGGLVGGVAYAEPQHNRCGAPGARGRIESTDCRANGGMGIADGAGRIARFETRSPLGHGGAADATGATGALVNASGEQEGVPGRAREPGGANHRWPDPLNGFWSGADWLGCHDGKFRPVEPGTFPLANGVLGRVGRLRGYGNAIVPQVAATFIKATGI